MDIALTFLILTASTGVAWILNKWYLLPKRLAKGNMVTPFWVRYTAEFFPVLLAIFALRSFLLEPFKVPSGSMIPTLQIGDYIGVNKFIYGIRLPVLNIKIVDLGSPQRGDIAVFRYPKDESATYVKRIVALPGDEIEYQNKRLKINGQELGYQVQEPYLDSENMRHVNQSIESYSADLGGNRHVVITNPEQISFAMPATLPDARYCHRNEDALICKVPPGHYFAMGDNRDNSADSRYWGFVPDKNLVGRASLVFVNFRYLARTGTVL